MKSASLILIFFLSYLKPVFSQTDTVKIQTSAVCETCKKTLEHDMSFEKGVKKAILDIDTKVLNVIFDPSKTNAEMIRIAVTKSGYDADTLKADPKAFKRLPECCKKPK